MNPTAPRCPWATTPRYIQYHDREWGVPQHDDRVLFEFLILEGAQAGLSWQTILEKRDNYRRAFDRFDARKVARYDARKVRKLKQLPARTPQSDAMSKDLLARGFKFVGPTICYAFMQAVGMVNDHLVDCFRYSEIE